MYDYSEYDNVYDALESRRYALVDVPHLVQYIMDVCISDETIEMFDALEIADIRHEYPPLMAKVGEIFHDPFDKAKTILTVALTWNFQRSRKSLPTNTLADIQRPFDHYPEIQLSAEDLLRWEPVREPRQVKKITTPDPEVIEAEISSLTGTIDNLQAEITALEASETVRRWKRARRRIDTARKKKRTAQSQLKTARRQRTFDESGVTA